MNINDLINRKNYLQQLDKLKDEHIIKVVTGLRRSGKSTLLEIFAQQIVDSKTALILRENSNLDSVIE